MGYKADAVKEDKRSEIYYFLEDPTKDKKGFMKKMLEQVKFDEEVGFAGYKNLDSLEGFLRWFVYGSGKITKLWKPISISECESEIKTVLEKCSALIKDNFVRVFVFPTTDSFAVDKLDGVSGFTPWKNTIILGVFNKEGWKKSLRETLCHELAHALALNFNVRETIGDDLVFEGIAEHLREHFLGGNKSKWVKSISEEEAKEIFKEIRGELKTTNDKLYSDLFFGKGKYPLWAGYAIGYYIVESFLDNLDRLDWSEVIKTSPSEVLRKSKYH